MSELKDEFNNGLSIVGAISQAVVVYTPVKIKN